MIDGFNGTSALGVAAVSNRGSLSALLLIACGSVIIAGFLTPIGQVVGSLVVAVTYMSLLRTDACAAQSGWCFLTVPLLLAASTGILGPGSYSVDARLFGRREIIIPGDNTEAAG